jgi:hypothetical protein
MRCTSCKALIGPWKTGFLIKQRTLTCKSCGAKLGRSGLNLKINLAIVIGGMIAMRYLSSRMDWWLALAIVGVVVIFIDWLTIDLEVRNSPKEAKLDASEN